MNFGILDPRAIEQAWEHNNALLGESTLGIEVTRPDLAARCGLGNIDPQHTGGDAGTAAIEVALTQALPDDKATLVTLRSDLDSIGAMAVLVIRSDIEYFHKVVPAGTTEPGFICAWRYGDSIETIEGLMDRVALVVQADTFAKGGYPGPRPLPTRDNPWPTENASAESIKELAAIAAAVSDFKVDPATRVEYMVKWLIFGNEPEGYRDKVEKERQDLITALENGEIANSTEADGKIAVVTSTHRAATMIGYCLAPVVVALNPEFRFAGGEPHTKFTICQYTGNFVDLKAVFSSLSEVEEGWGGSPTIGGSPQGVSSSFTIEQVVEVVEKHLC